VLGPSHHLYTTSCLISNANEIETPFGNLPVNQEIRNHLLRTGKFEATSKSIDENEHSIEMHFPYIAKIFGTKSNISVIPIIVGNLSSTSFEDCANILSVYLNDPGSLFIVSRYYFLCSTLFNVNF